MPEPKKKRPRRPYVQRTELPDPNAKPVEQDYAREKGGLFAKGNPGKPKGAISWANRKLAVACRELLVNLAPDHFKELFKDKKATVHLLRVRQDAIEWLAERGWGRAPLIVRTGGIEAGSPEAILLELAGQTRPTAIGEDEEDEETVQ